MATCQRSGTPLSSWVNDFLNDCPHRIDIPRRSLRFIDRFQSGVFRVDFKRKDDRPRSVSLTGDRVISRITVLVLILQHSCLGIEVLCHFNDVIGLVVLCLSHVDGFQSQVDAGIIQLNNGRCESAHCSCDTP